MLKPHLAQADPDVFDQIGLNPDAEARRELVKSIACSPPNRLQTAEVRHYTLACHKFPHRVSGEEEVEKNCRKTIGYVYFRVCDGPLDRKKDCDNNEKAASPFKKQGETPVTGHIIISHLK